MSILFIGKDDRQKRAKDCLAEQGHSVFSFVDKISAKEAISKISEFKVIALPLPASVEDMELGVSLPEGDKINVIDHIDPSAIVVGGKFSPALKKMLSERSIRYIDYYENESFQIKNAKLTSEGAMFTAMKLLNRALAGSKIAIIGFGRIGRLLAADLDSFGSYVTVCARKSTDLAWIECMGYTPLRISYLGGRSSLVELCEGYNVIFNTVPSWILDEDIASHMNKETVIIDLASSPFGIDEKLVSKYSLNYKKASGIPAKYAPQSAGEIVAQAINEILEREGIAL